MFRVLNDDATRRAVAKESFKLHLDGWDDVAISEKQNVEVWQVKSLREWWAQNFAPTPEQDLARKTALARAEGDLAYLSEIQQEIKSQYDQEQIDIRDYAKYGVMVVKTKTDIGVRHAKLLDLDSAVKVNVSSSSKLDDEIIALAEKFGAREEADLPLE